MFNVKDYGAVGNGTTNDAASINAAVAAAVTNGGGIVYLPAATYAVGATINLPTRVCIMGAGRDATILSLQSGANCDVIKSTGFDSLTNTGANTVLVSGIHHAKLAELTVDGNLSGQTTGGRGISIYGIDCEMENIIVRNCYGDGIWTEWASTWTGGTPANFDAIECRYQGVKIHDCGGHGWHHLGPTDCIITDVIIYNNGRINTTAIGFWADSDGVSNGSGTTTKFSASGLLLTNVHIWGQGHKWGFVLDAAVVANNCEPEGANVGNILARSGLLWTGGRIFFGYANKGIGIQLGDNGSTPGLPVSVNYTCSPCRINAMVDGFNGINSLTAAVNWVNCNTSAVDIQCKMRDAVSTTVAVGSNGVDISTFAGAGVLNVASAASYQTSGSLLVTTASGNKIVTYTGTTGTTFTGCSTTATSGATIATGAAVITNNQAIWGTPDTASRVNINMTGIGQTTLSKAANGLSYNIGKQTFEVGALGNGFTIKSNTADKINLNAVNNRVEFVSGPTLRLYSDGYTTQTGNWSGSTGQLSLLPTSGTVGQITKLGGGTADLAQWQNATPTTLAKVTYSGRIDASAGDGLTTKTKAGTPADTDFTATPTDGTLAVDTTNSKLYFRAGGAWNSASGGTSTTGGTASTGIYVPSDWGTFWKPKRNAAGSAKAVVSIVGASTDRGYYASNLATKSFPGLLRTALQTSYGDGGSGWSGAVDTTVFATGAGISAGAQTAYTSNGNYWTLTGTWAASSTSGGPGTYSINSSSSGATITMTGLRGTSIRVFTISNGGGNAGWSYSLDGGGAVAVTDGAGFTVQVTTISAGSAGPHTLVITKDATANNLYVHGADARNATGVIVDNFARYGSTSDQWNNLDNLASGTWSGGYQNPADLITHLTQTFPKPHIQRILKTANI